MEPKHIHQYARVKLTNSMVYRCMKIGCNHYLRPQFLVNKVAECPFCGKEYVVTRELSRRKLLRCSNCVVHKKDKIKPSEAVGFLEEIKND
jgi:transcription elongation factor Elf1